MGKSNLKWEDLESKITNSPDKEELFEDEEIKKEEVDVKKNKEKIKKESNKKIIIPIISIGIIILLIIIVSTIFAFININNTNIVNGVKIEGIDVSGLTKESAKEKIDSIYNKKKQKDIILKYQDYDTTINPELLEVSYDTEKAVEEAINVGKNSNIIINNYNILFALIGKKNINVNLED